jgi:hypothetical protein
VTGRGSIYRCYGWQGDLLYVGKTTRPAEVRIAEHRRSSPWGSEIADWSAERDPLGALDQAERDAIRREQPRYNTPIRPDCSWCNDRRCIVGPGYALVRCPRCSGGTWSPPFPAPLRPGPLLQPEVEPPRPRKEITS